MDYMKGYKDLIIWNQGIDLAGRVLALVKRLPSGLRYSLGDQMQRAAISIPSNLAEGYGRSSKNEMRRYTRIAIGSAMELETQLVILQKSETLEQTFIDPVTSQLQSVLRLLINFSKSLH